MQFGEKGDLTQKCYTFLPFSVLLIKMEPASAMNTCFAGCHNYVLNVNTRRAHLFNTAVTCWVLILAAEVAADW